MGWPELETDAGLWLAGAWGCLALQGASGELASWPEAEPKAEPKAGPKAEPKAEPPCFDLRWCRRTVMNPSGSRRCSRSCSWMAGYRHTYTSTPP